jgi:integrase
MLVPEQAVTVVIPSAASNQQRQKAGRCMRKRSGQSGSVRLVGTRWIGRYWRDVLGKDKREQPAIVLGEKATMTKPEARRKLLGILEAEGINTVQHLERALKTAVTFNQIADGWVTKRLPNFYYSSQTICGARLKKHVRPFFGQMALEDIKTGTINEWITQLNKVLEPKTIVNTWKLFRAICNWHLRQQDKPKVCWYPDLPALPDYEQRWFTPQEIDLIVDAATGQYKALFRLAGYTGMRCGELCALRVDDIHLEHGVVAVCRSVWEGHEGLTKNGKKRIVYLDSVTVEMLREYLAGRKSGRVFESRLGTHLVNREINRKALTPLCKRLGIEPGGMHSFRHGRVSHMQASRVPADFILSQIGHSSLRVTSLYTHFAHQQKRDLAEHLLSCAQTPQLCSLPN